MTQESLKAVFTLNQETGIYTSAGHNLGPEEAVRRATELANEGKKTQILDQPLKHKALTFNKCRACVTAAENLSQKRPGDIVPDESEDE